MKWLPAGVVIGVGLGGFADGIALHQIAQWHNMGSAVLPPVTMDAMSRNMMWDGLFHLATWTVTLIGVCMLWHAGRLAASPLPAAGLPVNSSLGGARSISLKASSITTS
jgi:uncharacterized membrane protein